MNKWKFDNTELLKTLTEFIQRCYDSIQTTNQQKERVNRKMILVLPMYVSTVIKMKKKNTVTISNLVQMVLELKHSVPGGILQTVAGCHP